MAAPHESAQWMRKEIERCGHLSQKLVVSTIAAEHVYTNRNGNLAIAKTVLKAFKELCPDVVFKGAGWRKRIDSDAPGRRQRSLTQAEYEAKTGERQV